GADRRRRRGMPKQLEVDGRVGAPQRPDDVKGEERASSREVWPDVRGSPATSWPLRGAIAGQHEAACKRQHADEIQTHACGGGWHHMRWDAPGAKRSRYAKGRIDEK